MKKYAVPQIANILHNLSWNIANIREFFYYSPCDSLSKFDGNVI